MSDTVFRLLAKNHTTNWKDSTKQPCRAVFFFLPTKKKFKASPEELLSIIIWGKATGWRGQRKLPGNSQRIVCSPGWGYNMYIHKAKLLMPDCQDKVCFHTHQKTPSGGFLWCHLRSFSRTHLELFASLLTVFEWEAPFCTPCFSLVCCKCPI